jgi:hypothetical protein
MADAWWQPPCSRAAPEGAAGTAAPESGGAIVRKVVAASVTLAVLLAFVAGLNVARASDRDETIITAQVSSADHELQEGYFTLGDSASVMVKPGSDLYKFLSRQRGRKIKVILSEAAGPELSRLER